MDWENLEAQANYIQRKIRDLEQKRFDVLYQDPEYAEYLDAFEDRGEGEPLSIRMFHCYQDEIECIFNSQPIFMSDDFEPWWKQNEKRICELEKLLLA